MPWPPHNRYRIEAVGVFYMCTAGLIEAYLNTPDSFGPQEVRLLQSARQLEREGHITVMPQYGRNNEQKQAGG
jgi:hypothetical protein